MTIRGRHIFSRRLHCLWIAAAFASATLAQAVILFRTADPSANTSEPTGDLAGSGWQFEGTFGNFLGTAIGPHHFITAQHIGAAPSFSFHGTSYPVVRSFDDPASDLRIWEVTGTLPTYASIYTGGSEIGQHIVVFGRGTQRGPEQIVGGQLRGWLWGASDMVQRWGENQIASTTVRSGRQLLYSLFDQAGLPQEAHLSGGDSGGGVFLNEAGIWKLAGVNFDVDTFTSGPDRGGPFNAALFDERGSFNANGSLVSGSAPVPSGFYSSRISTSFAWISSVLSPHLANISTRAAVSTGEQVCIAGFIIQGDPGQSKRVIIRGRGPSLEVNGTPIPGRMSDPLIELHNASGAEIFTNDNWRDSQAEEIQATGLAPNDTSEAAIVATLPAGNYTAILRDAQNRSGTGLIEIYDLDPTSAARLANLSTRGYVGTDDAVLIGGVIARSATLRLLLRALGPELSDHGVNTPLLNPKLELYDANGALLTSNDDWRTSPNSAAIAVTGLAPTSDREAAILLTSPVTNTYTAIVRGVNNTTGVALLEAYLVN